MQVVLKDVPCDPAAGVIVVVATRLERECMLHVGGVPLVQQVCHEAPACVQPLYKLMGCAMRSVPHSPAPQGLHAGHRTHLAQEVTEPIHPRGDYVPYNLADRT